MSNQTKDEIVRKRIDDRIFKEELKPLITKELVEEHRKKPIGHHSESLEKVLRHLRRHYESLEGKYVVVCTKPNEEWHLAEYKTETGESPKIFWDQTFYSVEEAEHGLFLKRLEKYGVKI